MASASFAASNQDEQNEQLKSAVLALGVMQDQLSGLTGSDFQRCLRARNGSIAKAAKLLAATCKWRTDMSLATLSADQFRTELAGGRMYVAGCDANGHSVLITRKRSDGFRPGESATQYFRFLAFSLETAVHTMQAGQESWIWIMDLAGYSRANSPPLSISLSTLRVLADHYPERLHKCFMVDAPAVFSYLWAALSPFIDVKTRGKVTFINSKDYQAHISAATIAATNSAMTGNSTLSAAVPDATSIQEPALENAVHDKEQKQPGAIDTTAVPKHLGSGGLDPAFLSVLNFYAAPYNEGSYINLLERVWPAEAKVL